MNLPVNANLTETLVRTPVQSQNIEKAATCNKPFVSQMASQAFHKAVNYFDFLEKELL